MRYTWDTNTLDGWHYTAYGSTPPSGNPPGDPNNLANRSAPLVWDGANDANNKIDASGSLRGSVPFTSANERIDFQAFSTGMSVRDWTGYIINAQVKLVSGGNFNPDCLLQARLYVSTAPSYATVLSTPASMTVGQWVTITFDMADAAVVTSMINQMGIQIETGGDCPFDAGTPVPEAGSDAVADTGPADVSLDGGPDDATAADAGDETTANDGGVPDASDAGPPPPPQATTEFAGVLARRLGSSARTPSVRRGRANRFALRARGRATGSSRRRLFDRRAGRRWGDPSS